MELGRNQLQHLEVCEIARDKAWNIMMRMVQIGTATGGKAGLVADHDADVGPDSWN
jgi:hypothetical protein